MGTGSSDSPGSGARVSVEVREGDVVVLATDGVTDNVFDDELLALVNKGTELHASEAEIAAQLAGLASRKANSPVAATPFASAVAKLGHEFAGGKLDDITVVVAFVVPDTAPASAKL